MTAEERFTATQKKDKQAMSDREKERQDMTDKIAKLKALRLAKEAAEQEAAESKAVEKTTAKKRKVKTA
jgi:hypothetical protein